jgi:hypothetical protein
MHIYKIAPLSQRIVNAWLKRQTPAVQKRSSVDSRCSVVQSALWLIFQNQQEEIVSKKWEAIMQSDLSCAALRKIFEKT